MITKKLTKPHLQAVRDLIKKYNSITDEDLKTKTVSDLTGRGNPETCTLCLSITKGKLFRFSIHCKRCIHSISSGEHALFCFNHKTYRDNTNNTSIWCHSRAKYLQSLLAKYDKIKIKKGWD